MSRIVVPAVCGAVAGALVCLVCCMTCCKKEIAVVNVQEIVAASTKVRDLQAEQRTKIESLAEFVKKANDEIAKEKKASAKAELETKYANELAAQKAAIEAVYVEKLTEISNELSANLSAAAADKGYPVVLTKDAVVSGSKDITAELLEVVK